jgi:lipid II:glycine glycyltransferase (peptidoglycan interpeptide bridge formation enzyme)
MIGWKEKGYYLLAGRDKAQKPDGSPSKILWQAMKDLNAMGIKKINLCGANKPNIKLFKRGFGGKLVAVDKPCLSY